MAGNDLILTTSDGVRLVYDDEGEGSAVVLLHGFDCQRTDWAWQREALLAAGHRVVALDQRCHGDSDVPQHGQRMARLGADVRELLDLLDLHDVTLVGHSMGVSVSLAMFAVSGTDRIGRLVAIDQTPKIINDEGWHFGVRKVQWQNAYDCVHFRAEWGDDDLEPPMPEGSPMPLEWKGDLDSRRTLLVDHFVADWRDVLPRIDAPTWVVTGRLSPYYDLAGMEWFASQVPNGRLSVFEKSGHQPHINEVEDFNRQLLDFITSTS
jgi:non-heme chloroperoxidase